MDAKGIKLINKAILYQILLCIVLLFYAFTPCKHEQELIELNKIKLKLQIEILKEKVK